MTDTQKPGAPHALRCESLENPLGLDAARPRLSWQLSDPRRGAVQTAYQIQVASSHEFPAGHADVWDSGQVASDASVHVPYAGPALTAGRRYGWRVRTWDAAGEASAWSAPAFWEMGLLGAPPADVRWIGAAPVDPQSDSGPCPYLRRRFAVDRRVVRARLYAAARGVMRLFVNGRRVGSEEFVPGWTDYGKRVQYMTYDVTDLLAAGDNAIGAILGDGWYSGHIGWGKQRGYYGKQPLLAARLVAECDDGTQATVVTDAQWRVATGPLLASDIYNGETYDARLERPGWAEAAFDDGGWQPATTHDVPAVEWTAKRCPPVRAIEELRPVEITEPTPGAFIFHLGQNIVGWVRLRVTAPAGTRITLRHGERLQADGTLYTANLRSARATDVYICRGGGEEIYEPSFTFHGFEYVEVTGYPGRPGPEAVTGVVLHSDLPEHGVFECSNADINQLQSNIRWGQKGNFLEVPTDCPQRNERLGWTGDAQVFARTACFNMDAEAFFTKWMQDLRDAQYADGRVPDVCPDVLGLPTGAGNARGVAAWADAVVIVPWTVYQCFGDVGILAENFDAMAAWVEFMRASSDRLIRPVVGYGDWLAIDAVTPGAAPTPRDLIGTAYFAHCARLVSKAAGLLGREADGRRFAELSEQVVAAFRREFVTPAGRVVGHTQTGYLLALAFDLLPAEQRSVALGHLVADIERRGGKLSTGFVGTPLLAPVLSRFGRTDVAYTLLLQDEYPSWLYPIRNGATTMWERWNSWTREKGFGEVGMNSFNHYAYGAIGEWLYAKVGGLDVDPDCPGYRHLIVAPEPGGGLTWARAELDTPYGRAASHWRMENDRFELDLTVPPNACATITLPVLAGADLTESARGVAGAEGIHDVVAGPSGTQLGATAGTYRFAARLP